MTKRKRNLSLTNMAAHLIRKMVGKAPTSLIKWMGNFWFPYLGAGVKVVDVGADYRYMKICLKKRWYNSNYVGTQFGGSMYSMTDPFYMVMLINNLGRDYIVWDKAGYIEFLRPGKTDLFAEFRIDQALIDKVIEETNKNEKYVFNLPVEIVDTRNKIIAKVDKTLFVQKKKPKN